MKLEDIGAHCCLKYCKTKDFLPFVCNKCNQTFCLEHRTCKAHECPKADVDDVMLIICPICSMKIRITGEVTYEESELRDHGWKDIDYLYVTSTHVSLLDTANLDDYLHL